MEGEFCIIESNKTEGESREIGFQNRLGISEFYQREQRNYLRSLSLLKTPFLGY
jgi:hypothetical protein